MSKRVLILPLDTFAAKNSLQLDYLGAAGYVFDIATNDLRGDSRERFARHLDTPHRLLPLPPGPLGKVRTAWRLLGDDRYGHVEVYAAGRLALVYLLMAKLKGRRILVIERGDIGVLRRYDWLTRLGLTTAYRVADAVVYREPFMTPLLARYRNRDSHFLPNPVKPPIDPPRPRDSRLFAWVNRIIDRRRPLWVARAFADRALHAHRLVIMGLEDDHALQQELRATAPANVTLLPFGDPRPLYDEATFFCMAAETVYGNNALLEAMVRGLIPVVTESPGIERLVEDGVNGIVTAFDEDAYRHGVIRAAGMDADERARLSANARATVRDRHAPEVWAARMVGIYERLHGQAS